MIKKFLSCMIFFSFLFFLNGICNANESVLEQLNNIKKTSVEKSSQSNIGNVKCEGGFLEQRNFLRGVDVIEFVQSGYISVESINDADLLQLNSIQADFLKESKQILESVISSGGNIDELITNVAVAKKINGFEQICKINLNSGEIFEICLFNIIYAKKIKNIDQICEVTSDDFHNCNITAFNIVFTEKINKINQQILVDNVEDVLYSCGSVVVYINF